MELEKNPKTRPIAKKLLKLADRLAGKAFPGMDRVKEISNYTCGPATLVMLLSFVGVRVSQRRLIRSMRAKNKIKAYGVDINDMAKATKVAGKGKLAFWRKKGARVSDIASAITKFKYPVGVEWQGDFYENEDEDKGHYAVVTSIDRDSGYLRMSDPYFNTFFDYRDIDRKYRLSEFVKKWWDINEIKVAGTSKTRAIKDIRVMFVITPKGESWPKKLGMTKAS